MKTPEVIEALEARHGHDKGWLYAKEFMAIDFLALAFWGSYSNPVETHPWLAYELKVSRGDMRGELLKPDKRAWAEKISNAFLFAVPKGMLKKEELAWEEPEDLSFEHFRREPCPGNCHRHRGKRRSEVYLGEGVWERCRVCGGKGYARRSWIEENAPTLWVPRGAGLVEILPGGSRMKKQPVYHKAESLSRYHTALLMNTAWNPGFLRTMRVKKQRIDWEEKQVRLRDEQAAREAARAREVLVERLGHLVERGSSWLTQSGRYGFQRCVVVSRDGETVRVTTPELSYDPRVPVGDLLLDFVLSERSASMAA